MRSFLLVGAAALVAASPAPQAFDPNSLGDLVANEMTQGPPVGPGAAAETGYVQSQALATAAAAVTTPATANAQHEKRWWWPKPTKTPKPPAPTPTPTPAPQSTPASQPSYNPTSTNTAPSSCTPVGWTNTWAFTSTTACPTAIEVGTYCGFINPLDPCAAQPNAYGPDTTPDTVDAFKNNPVYADLAKKAKTPSGYDQAFSNLGGSVQGSGYLGYKVLTSYDPAQCSAYCDSTATCTGFNIFIERDPKWNPDKCSCESPSIAQIKCSIWGQQVKPEAATNVGQNQAGFEVIIVASNGYNKKPAAPPTPPKCSKPQNCGGKLHNQQPYCMGQKTFPGPFDPSLCAAYAQTQNSVNKKWGLSALISSWFGYSNSACVQFQAAYLEKNGVGVGTHCRLFTKKFTAAQANLDLNADSSAWGCQQSYTWDVEVDASFNWGFSW